MSEAGHDVCIFINFGDCAVTTAGAASVAAAAPAAKPVPFMNLRRETDCFSLVTVFLPFRLLRGLCRWITNQMRFVVRFLRPLRAVKAIVQQMFRQGKRK
jgi:hypothetical protein